MFPKIDFKELFKKDDIFYKKFSDDLFARKVYGREKGSMKNGKREVTMDKAL